MRLGRRTLGALVLALAAPRCGSEPPAPRTPASPVADLARLLGPFGPSPTSEQRRTLEAFARTWQAPSGVDLERLRWRVTSDIAHRGSLNLGALSSDERALVRRLVLDLARHPTAWAALAGSAPLGVCG